MATHSPLHRLSDMESLLTEILLLLPAKPLVKFKSVSRRWNSIISSDPFTRTHTRLHQSNSEPTSVVFLRQPVPNADSSFNYHFVSLPSGPLSPTPFRFRIPFQSPKLLQSCNGLLLFSVTATQNLTSYCIYNPATCQFKAIPKFRLGYKPDVLGISLAYDPSRFQGFKLICVISHCYCEIMSYCSSNESWKERASRLLEAPREVAFHRGVYWKSAIHWISMSDNSIYFDVVNETFGRFPSPPIPPSKIGCNKFCVLNEELHYLDVDAIGSLNCNVYNLLGYDEGWILKYNVDASSLGKLIGPWRAFSVPWIIECEGKRECGDRRLEMVAHWRDELVAYNFETNTWRTLCEDRHPFVWYDACPYTATFAFF